jgi:SAM-dependent methyltransferase
MKSYTTFFSKWQISKNGYLQLLSILEQKRKINKQNDSSDLLKRAQWIKDSASKLTGQSFINLKTLEIGHGQMPLIVAYFASLGNQSYGIDLDVTPQGLTDFANYYQLLKKNGWLRTIKTLTKELTGFNKVIKKEFIKQTKLASWPKFTLLQGDAKNIPFPDQYFDFIYSTDVFEHLENPALVIDEIIRLLKPGGSIWLAFLHYGHANALHDLRWITQSKDAPQPWSHLIPDYSDNVQQGAFVNTLRLQDWESLFHAKCPGVVFDKVYLDDSKMKEFLKNARMKGYLSDYDDEELLTNYYVVAWKKP